MNQIVDKIISFDNKDELTWIEVYRQVLKSLNINKINDDSLLIDTVKELTRLGYDIYDKPFRLEKYR